MLLQEIKHFSFVLLVYLPSCFHFTVLHSSCI